MVIAIHTFPPLDISSVEGTINIFIRQIVGFPVPLFLAISGYYLGKKILESKEQKLLFWKKQILKVYLPALIWAIPLYILSIKNGDSFFKSTILLLGCGFSIYYFIALIIQCYIILPLLQKIRPCIGLLITSSVSVISIILISWFDYNRLPLIIYAGPIVTWAVFFYMGILLSKSKREYKITLLYILIPLCIIACLIESYLLQTNNHNGWGIKFTTYIYSATIILLLFSKHIESRFNADGLVNRFINNIGRISFPLYLMHCYVITIVFKFINIQNYLMRWLLVSGCSILLVILMRRIIPSKFHKLLGLL